MQDPPFQNVGKLEPNSKPQIDLWRDSPLRYLGYANEVGEAFRPLYPRFVVPSYIIAFGYVGMDTFDKTYKSYNNMQSSANIARDVDKNNRKYPVLLTAVDTFLWQLFASVLIPGKTIHFITNRAEKAINSEIFQGAVDRYAAKSLPPNKLLLLKNCLRLTPTCIGLLTIPIIIHPIDNLVDFAMDNTIRKYY
jgi:fission process protein 1